MITASERAKTVHALDRSATVTGHLLYYSSKYTLYIHIYNIYIYIMCNKFKTEHYSPVYLWLYLSSLARTLRSWVRIPLKAWMFVCVYSAFMLSCVHIAALRRADHSSKESYRLCKKDYETEEEARAKQRAVEPLMN
jgi:hypothetical protein